MNEIINVTVDEKAKDKTPIEIALKVDDENMVSAKDLYDFLEYDSTHYARWCNDNLINNPVLEENVDFWAFRHNGENSQGGRPSVDYKISLDVAKEIALAARSEKGKAARRYFLKCEKALVITVQQYNDLLDNYNNLKTKIGELETKFNDDLILLSARMDGYNEGKVLLDKEKAEFIKDTTDTLKEMMPDFGYEGEKYGKMLSDVIAKMEEIDRVPFSYYTDAYLKQKNLGKVNNRLEVIAEYDELQDLFYSAIKCIYNNKLVPFDLSDFGNVITGEELLNGYI